MIYNLPFILDLLEIKDRISFRTKKYNGNSISIQVNNNKTFQYNYTSLTTNVVISGITKKELEDIHTYLLNKKYDEIKPIDYN